jgi:beta-glucosidase/6-phospho-beta-glucosidase/beta-galactosidase
MTPNDLPLFKSFFMGGFECSTHRLSNGQRLDLLQATHHDQVAEHDFEQLQRLGIRSVRSGVRWHRIEQQPGVYTFDSELPMIRAAEATQTQVVWDLFHYGWPDFLDIFSETFIEHFAQLASNFAKVIIRESRQPVFVSPVNEISFFAWAAGDKGFFNPFVCGRGDELKTQMVRAYIAAARVLKQQIPGVRLVSPEPVIHIVPQGSSLTEAHQVETYLQAQYAAWDMISGRLLPELGGRLEYLDILGLNYYPKNQWLNFGRNLRPSHPRYKPFRAIIQEVFERYQRPMLVAETGTEGRDRRMWLKYIASEVRASVEAGLPIHGLCWYPIVDYPGWDDNRHCPAGLLSYVDEQGKRSVFEPLGQELDKQQKLLARNL